MRSGVGEGVGDVRAKVSRWLAVADEVVRIVKFLGLLAVLCAGEAVVAVGPWSQTGAAWGALGVLVAAQVALIVLCMVRWPAR